MRDNPPLSKRSHPSEQIDSSNYSVATSVAAEARLALERAAQIRSRPVPEVLRRQKERRRLDRRSGSSSVASLISEDIDSDIRTIESEVRARQAQNKHSQYPVPTQLPGSRAVTRFSSIPYLFFTFFRPFSALLSIV
jgi:hypothetical protein